MKAISPRFIVFEGIDGTGKTTLSKMLQDYLREQGVEAGWFREPGDSPWGREIRRLAAQTEQLPFREELNYFLEDRRWNVNTNILPHLQSGRWVLLDRYYFSSACYQGARGEMDMMEIIALNEVFAPPPDLAFVIDVDVDVALERIRGSREGEALLFEKREYLLKVRENYHRLRERSYIRYIDGDGPVAGVFQAIIRELAGFLDISQ